MSTRALLVPFSLSLLVACDQIKELAGGGDETTVHTNEDTDDDPPPPPPPDMDEEPENLVMLSPGAGARAGCARALPACVAPLLSPGSLSFLPACLAPSRPRHTHMRARAPTHPRTHARTHAPHVTQPTYAAPASPGQHAQARRMANRTTSTTWHR